MTSPEHPTAATMYCLGCGYCLDGLTQFRCPECGREFDPTKPESTSDMQTYGEPRLLGVSFLAVAIVGAGLVVGPLTGTFGRLDTGTPVCLGLALQLGVLVAGLSALAFDRYRRAPVLYLAIVTAIVTLV